MMIESHRHTSKRSPNPSPSAKAPLTLLALHGPFADHEGPWVDALDPSLPSDPPLAAPQHSVLPPRYSHKLILSGASFGVGALVAGYLAAFLLW